MLYVRTTDGVTSFTDDGYTMASFDLNGVTITESRRERINRLALRFGAMVGDDGQITLETEGSRPDAMNRFVQALTDIGSMLETSQKRVLSYFADDVALKLDSCQVFYTPNVGIRGVSSYEHSFGLPVPAQRQPSDPVLPGSEPIRQGRREGHHVRLG